MYTILATVIAVIISFLLGMKRGKDRFEKSTQLDALTTAKNITKNQNVHAGDDINAVRQRLRDEARDQT